MRSGPALSLSCTIRIYRFSQTASGLRVNVCEVQYKEQTVDNAQTNL